MYRIEEKPYGFRVTTDGALTLEEVTALKRDLLDAATKFSGPFSLFLDSRKMIVPTPPVLEVFTQLHAQIWKLPCQRVAFVIESPVSHRRAVQMHYSSAPGSNDRFINALQFPDWESRAEGWVINGVEPESARSPKAK